MQQENLLVIDADEYVSVKPGQPFRLFKFGDIYKNGRKRSITRDMRFKLPQFKPPIKLGSHQEATPAGGFITQLEYREDGIYVDPEWNEEGLAALEKGSYRYHSPEVIWEDGGLEDPDTGNITEGPLIVGMALTNTPHLGESTALYTYQQQEQQIMGEQVKDTIEVPQSWLEKLFAPKHEEAPAPETQPEIPEEYTAAVKERDEYKAQLEQYEAEKKQAELFAAIRTEFDTEEYGAAFKGMADTAVEMLAKIDEEPRKWVLEQFKALSAQAEKSGLEEEIGDDEVLPGGAQGYAAAIEAYMKANDGVDYVTAAKTVAAEKPELYREYQGGK